MSQDTIAFGIFAAAGVVLAYRLVRYSLRGDQPAFGWWRW
jgi:hypothetical protein